MYTKIVVYSQCVFYYNTVRIDAASMSAYILYTNAYLPDLYLRYAINTTTSARAPVQVMSAGITDLRDRLTGREMCICTAQHNVNLYDIFGEIAPARAAAAVGVIYVARLSIIYCTRIYRICIHIIVYNVHKTAGKFVAEICIGFPSLRTVCEYNIIYYYI